MLFLNYINNIIVKTIYMKRADIELILYNLNFDFVLIHPCIAGIH
jgi:hypothetical protein